jgi:uncharacterized RDD family membrane protein YckC
VPARQPARFGQPPASRASEPAPRPAKLGSPYPKADLLPRLLARLFDLMICGGLIALSHEAGAVVGALYLLFADGLFQGQSPGKKLLGLKVIHLPTQKSAGARISALRNYPMALVGLLALASPSSWGALAAGSVLVLGYEAYKVLTDPLGLRLGDELAHTQVVDGKVVAGGRMLAGAGDGRGPSVPHTGRMPRRFGRAARSTRSKVVRALLS